MVVDVAMVAVAAAVVTQTHMSNKILRDGVVNLVLTSRMVPEERRQDTRLGASHHKFEVLTFYFWLFCLL